MVKEQVGKKEFNSEIIDKETTLPYEEFYKENDKEKPNMDLKVKDDGQTSIGGKKPINNNSSLNSFWCVQV